jgi:hypothetical protein
MTPKAERLVFDETRHLYWLMGREVPSVSTVIRDLGETGHYRGDAGGAMARGSRVHLLTQRDDAGKLEPPANIDDAGYLDAWRAWRASFGGSIDKGDAELRVGSAVYRYAGTLDRVIRFPCGRVVVVEIKTGGEAKWHRLQTAAYTIAFCEDGHAGIGRKPEELERLAVYLNPDGTYRERLHTNPADLLGWKAGIVFWHWRKLK